jgi:hypothetical protein
MALKYHITITRVGDIYLYLHMASALIICDYFIELKRLTCSR